MKNNVKTGIYNMNGEEKTFDFKTSLNVNDKVRFINTVIAFVVNDKNYYSVLRDIAFDFAIIDVFSSVDVSDIYSSSNVLASIENLLDMTNIVSIVKANVDDGVMEELNKSVDNNIEYKTGIHKNPIAESLAHLLNTVEKKIDGIDTEKMMQMAEVMSGISGELTPEKVIDAYAKSDIFKEKYTEIIANRDKHNAEIETTATAIKNVLEKGKKTRNSKKVVPMNPEK